MDKIKLIIVDDDESWLKTFTQFLSKEPDLFIVGSATNKQGAIELIKSQNADFVLLDLNLDHVPFEGITITQEIKLIKKIKVIIITAYEDPNLMKNSLLAGAIDYYPKSKIRDIPNVLRLAHNNVSPAEILFTEYYKLQTEIFLQNFICGRKGSI